MGQEVAKDEIEAYAAEIGYLEVVLQALVIECENKNWDAELEMKAIIFIIVILFLSLCGSAQEEAETRKFPIKFESRVLDVKMIGQGGRNEPMLKRWVIRVEVPKELKNKIRPATELSIHVISPTRFLRSAGPHEGKIFTIECAVLRPVLTDLECRATAKKSK